MPGQLNPEKSWKDLDFTDKTGQMHDQQGLEKPWTSLSDPVPWCCSPRLFGAVILWEVPRILMSHDGCWQYGGCLKIPVLKYPQIIIPFRLGVSMKYCKSEKLLGYEHDYGNLHIQCLKLIKCGSQHTGAKPKPICSRSFRKVLESIISFLSSQQTTSSRPFREKNNSDPLVHQHCYWINGHWVCWFTYQNGDCPVHKLLVYQRLPR